MKYLYLLPVLALLSACTSGSIFGEGSSEKNGAKEPSEISEKQPAARPDYVPYQSGRNRAATSKQIYTILASRAANKMLKATVANYAGAKYPPLYIATPVVEGGAAVPEHAEYAAVVTKDIIAGSHSYAPAARQSQADYVLEAFVRSNSVISRGTAVIVYKLVLKDKRQNEIGVWVETLSPIINDDKSWW